MSGRGLSLAARDGSILRSYTRGVYERGLRLGRLVLERPLGDGGQAFVWAARQEDSPGFVAVKIVDGLAARDELYLQRLQNEARLGTILRHPNLVRVHGFESATGPNGRPLHLLVMELVDGWTVHSILRSPSWNGAWPPLAALQLIRRAAEGIGYAHRTRDDEGRPLGLVHRDLKPSNLMLGRDGSTKVLDFGIAWDADRDGEATATGVALGTPAFMSPEQVLGDPILAGSDVFALAAVLFELLLGRRVVEGKTAVAVVRSLLGEDHEELARQVDGVVPGLGPIFARMRAPLVKDRMTDGMELAEELDELLQTRRLPPPDLSGFAQGLDRGLELPTVEAPVPGRPGVDEITHPAGPPSFSREHASPSGPATVPFPRPPAWTGEGGAAPANLASAAAAPGSSSDATLPPEDEWGDVSLAEVDDDEAVGGLTTAPLGLVAGEPPVREPTPPPAMPVSNRRASAAKSPRRRPRPAPVRSDPSLYRGPRAADLPVRLLQVLLVLLAVGLAVLFVVLLLVVLTGQPDVVGQVTETATALTDLLPGDLPC